MGKSRYLILLNFLLSASIAFSGGASYPPAYNVNLANVTITIGTIVPYSLAGQGQGSHTINEVFFLGRYTKGVRDDGTPDTNLHLFCRESDASTGAVLDVDLGPVDSVLSETSLYVWSTDPQADDVHIDAHYPPRLARYVTNTKPGTAAASTNKRVEVNGAGKGTDGVHAND
jgi:hypothetical protein